MKVTFANIERPEFGEPGACLLELETCAYIIVNNIAEFWCRLMLLWKSPGLNLLVGGLGALLHNGL